MRQGQQYKITGADIAPYCSKPSSETHLDGIAPDIISAIEKAQADPAFKIAAERAFAPIRYLAPAAYEAELKADDVRFRALWKELPWTDK